MVRAATRALRSTDTVRLVALALTAGSLAFAGCGGATPKARSAAKSVKSSKSGPPPRYVTPARLFALPQGSGVTTNAVDPDGTRRLIVHGIRVVQRVDGSLERAKEVFPGGRSVSFVELPDRLGGGYVFYTNASGTALIWRAKTWAGQLEPMANVDLDVEQIVPGFDRLYVVDRRSVDVVALDSETGKPTDLGSLPVAPAYSDMAFADEWVGAVEVPYQGILATFDAGSSWRRIDVYPTYGVKLEGQGIIMSTAVARLDPKFISLVWAGPERAVEVAEMHGQLFQPAWNEASMQETLSHPGSIAFMARVREGADALPEPAGFVIGQIAADEAEILSIGVLPKFQRRGVGTLLIEGLARAAKRSEVNRLFLEVAADNQSAFELYRSCGFTAVGMRKGYYERAGAEPQDALVLALPLDR